MRKKQNAAFLILEAVLFLSFSFADSREEYRLGNELRYLAVCSCVLYFYTSVSKQEQNPIKRTGKEAMLLCILFADFFLLFTDRILLGILCFIIMQSRVAVLLAALRPDCGQRSLQNRGGNRFKCNAWMAAGAAGFFAAVWFLFLGKESDALLCVAIVYAGYSVRNFLNSAGKKNVRSLVTVSYQLKEANHMRRFLACGLLLLMICDLHIAWFYLMPESETGRLLYQLFYQGEWNCYMPALCLFLFS